MDRWSLKFDARWQRELFVNEDKSCMRVEWILPRVAGQMSKNPGKQMEKNIDVSLEVVELPNQDTISQTYLKDFMLKMQSFSSILTCQPYESFLNHLL